MSFQIRLRTILMLLCVLALLASCSNTNSVQESSQGGKSAVEGIEPEIQGFEEVTNGTDGSLVKIQGLFDPKFICNDVNEFQQSICTTALTGNSSEKRFMWIRLRVCSEQNRSNCIDWSQSNRHIDDVRVYDFNSNLIDWRHSNNFTGKIIVTEGKGRFVGPIEKIESPVDLYAWQPAKYGELTVGKSKYEDMIRELGSPLSSGPSVDQEKPKPIIWHEYGNGHDSLGRMAVETDIRDNRIVGISFVPEKMFRNEMIKTFGNTFVETGYKLCEGFDGSGSTPIYPSPDSDFKFIEYKSHGISIAANDHGVVTEINYLEKPMGLSSRADCKKKIQRSKNAQ